MKKCRACGKPLNAELRARVHSIVQGLKTDEDLWRVFRSTAGRVRSYCIECLLSIIIEGDCEESCQKALHFIVELDLGEFTDYLAVKDTLNYIGWWDYGQLMDSYFGAPDPQIYRARIREIARGF
jgi:hypothetical protein